MRKRFLAILICAFFVVATAVPALACTPRLHVEMPDMQPIYDAAYEAGKKAAENVVIPDSYFKTETETESETEPETEPETEKPLTTDWSSYFSESFTNMIERFRKEVNSKWNRLSTMSNQN